MKITLNSDLKKINLREQSEFDKSNIVFGTRIKATTKQSKISGEKNIFFPDEVKGLDTTKRLQYGFLNTLATAYSYHHSVKVNPHDIWFIVLNEIMEYVAEFPEQCAPVFTNNMSGEKIKILVPTGNVEEVSPELLVEQLSQYFPVAAFIPRLTTTGPKETAAMCAALCGGVQRHYEYMTFLCGIPEIEIGGTAEDWQSLLGMSAELAMMFKAIGATDLVLYLIRVADILDEVQRSYFMDKTDFWKDIFTSTNVGSGPQLEISGWITKIYLKEKPKYRLDNLDAQIAVLPYTNTETGRKFLAAYGAFYMANNDGVLSSEYDNFVLEIKPE